MSDSAAYYARRAKRELDLANQASDPKAREIHLELARRYLELAQYERGLIPVQ